MQSSRYRATADSVAEQLMVEDAPEMEQETTMEDGAKKKPLYSRT